MIWLSYVFFAGWLTLGGWMIGTTKKTEHIEAKWSKIGAKPCLVLVNHKPFPVFVSAAAPEVDSVTRYVGVAPPEDSVMLDLPYGDTMVKLIFSGPRNEMHVWLYVAEPKCYRLELSRGTSVPDTTSGDST